VEYSLTPLGIETARRAEDLVEWIQVDLVEMLPDAEMPSPGVDR
jgi:DNA-binding HxlR family transcriptional regulator